MAMTTYPVSSVNPGDVERIAANWARLQQRILEAGGDPQRVRVVAVTKTFDPATVRAALAAGLRVMGENYVDELELKRAEVADSHVRWHYLGALQSNKIARIVEAADVLSGVAREKEIRRIATLRPGACIDVQVDFTGGVQRNGADASQVATLVHVAREEGLDVRGLMSVASPDQTVAREQFRRVDSLAGELGLPGRSMGMSDDFELAVACGSTEVRIGRALFGPRPRPTVLT